MLKELMKADWLRILDLPASRIPDVVILRGTRNFRSQYKAMLPYFDKVLELGTPNGILEDVLIGEVDGHSVGFACVYGSSMASEVVHLFGVLGTRTVIQIGNCGALADGFLAGDLFLAERAFCGEGAAQYYKPGGKWVAGSLGLLQSKTLSALNEGDYRLGSIYSTAALFAEGEEDIEQWFQGGFAAVDLETAATYAVAEYFRMDRLSILYAFDNPRCREHLLLSDAAKDARRAESNARMIRLALDLAVEISSRGKSKRKDPGDKVEITRERPDSPDAVALITELEAHLETLYPPENRFGYSVEKLLTQAVAFFVLRENGMPVGCGGIQLFGTEYGELKRMYVRRAFVVWVTGRCCSNIWPIMPEPKELASFAWKPAFIKPQPSTYMNRWGFNVSHRSEPM